MVKYILGRVLPGSLNYLETPGGVSFEHNAREEIRSVTFADESQEARLLWTLRRLHNKGKVVVKIGGANPALLLNVSREQNIFAFHAEDAGVKACYAVSGERLVIRFANVLLRSRRRGLTGANLVVPVEFDLVKVDCSARNAGGS